MLSNPPASMLMNLQSDLASSAEFVPGYSSFLFNQLLQTQFYSVNQGGLSININLADRNQSNPSSVLPAKSDGNVLSLSSIIAAEPHVITSSPTLAHIPPNSYTTPVTLNSQPIDNVNMKIKNEVNNVNSNNSNKNSNNNSSTTLYKSSVFQQLLATQKNPDNKYFEREVRFYEPIYPAIDLLEYFGEREVVELNKMRLQSLLYDDWCNLEIVKVHSNKFVPTDMRPMVWQLLLGYLPAEKSKRETVLLSKQKLYNDKCNYAASLKNDELVTQIEMDVLRTLPEGHERMFGNPAVKQALSRVLQVWAVNHPATGYFQGLNDLASPFFQTFLFSHSTYQVGRPAFFDDHHETDLWQGQEGEAHLKISCGGGNGEGGGEVNGEEDGEFMPGLLRRVEADVYWCLCAVLDCVEHLNAYSKCGVHGEIMMSQLEALVRVIDAPLDAHMREEHLEYVHFSFPWMLCLFVREAKMANLLVLWDFYLSHPLGFPFAFSSFHIYICAAFLIRFRDVLITMEFPDMLKFLHRPPTKDWTTKDMYALIDHATFLHKNYPMPPFN